MQQPAPWWHHLPDDYYRHAVPTHLDPKFPLKVHGSAAMDRVLRTGLAAMVSSALTPLLAFPDIRRRELDALADLDIPATTNPDDYDDSGKEQPPEPVEESPTTPAPEAPDAEDASRARVVTFGKRDYE
jgi:hypothetical protein